MTHSDRQAAIQAFIDKLTPIERHRVCWLLNYDLWYAWSNFPREYDLEYLELLRRFKFAPIRTHYRLDLDYIGTAGKDTER